MAHFTRDHEIFETPDYEPEPYNYDDDQKSAAIQTLDITMKSSYSKFEGKILDNKDIDFSDSIDKKPQCGFKVQPSEFGGMSSERTMETVMERFLRLKEEVGELTCDLQRLESSRENSDKLLEVSPSDLLQDVELLQKQLHGLQLDRVLGSETTTGAEHPYQAILMRDLKTQVEALKVEDDGSRSSAGGLPVYEVYTRTEAAKFAHFSKLSELENRLMQLEGLVGNNESEVSSVAGGLDSKAKDLSASVLNLQARVALLDYDHVATISSQLEGLLTLLNQAETQASAKTEDLEKSAKVEEALQCIDRLSAVLPMLPDVVERLHALKELHERASQFAGSVTYISDQQDKMSGQITEVESTLKQVQASLQKNITALHSEFSSLGSKIATLKE